MERVDTTARQMVREPHAARAPTDDQGAGRRIRIARDGSDERSYAAS
jgi:hypothetical protein